MTKTSEPFLLYIPSADCNISYVARKNPTNGTLIVPEADFWDWEHVPTFQFRFWIGYEHTEVFKEVCQRLLRAKREGFQEGREALQISMQKLLGLEKEI